MISTAMPQEWGPPAKNWLKQRAGLILNDSALQWVWAEIVRQKPDPRPPKSLMPSRLPNVSGQRTGTRSGFTAQAIRLAGEPIPGDSFDYRNVKERPSIGTAFQEQRQSLLNLLTRQAHAVWGELAPEYLHWLRLEFLLDMTPDKRRDLLLAQWIPSWPEPIRHIILEEYQRLEQLLHHRDAQYRETKQWKNRERSLFRDLWESEHRPLWNHRTLIGTLTALSLRRRGQLRYWHPWDFATTLHHQKPPPLSSAQEAQLDAWLEGCATGQFDPNDPHALEKFLSTY